MTFLLSFKRRRLGDCHVTSHSASEGKMPKAQGRPSRQPAESQRYLLALLSAVRRNLMSPVVVRTFSVGPPPFNFPSAEQLFGPGQSPPSLVTRMSVKSD